MNTFLPKTLIFVFFYLLYIFAINSSKHNLRARYFISEKRVF
jgi:hypothetical protein